MFLAKYPHNSPKRRDVFLYISTRYTKKSYTFRINVIFAPYIKYVKQIHRDGIVYQKKH